MNQDAEVLLLEQALTNLDAYLEIMDQVIVRSPKPILIVARARARETHKLTESWLRAMQVFSEPKAG